MDSEATLQYYKHWNGLETLFCFVNCVCVCVSAKAHKNFGLFVLAFKETKHHEFKIYLTCRYAFI